MTVLVTGGGGFIGANVASRLLAAGHEVRILDDLSRPGARLNIDWLRDELGADSFDLHKTDLRDREGVAAAVAGCDVVYHLGAQVAVTTSVEDPMTDFEVNALGTLNVLESIRDAGEDPVVIYSSTNKVYGEVRSEVREEATRYELVDLPLGVPEDHPLQLRTPYGCSKGLADQYVVDYHHTFGLRTVVFRQSCIYGPRQFGHEDQGWVAWMLRAAQQGMPIRIYGDGKQVRDVLYVDELVDVYQAAVERIDSVQGQVFNIGGGPSHRMSIWAEFGPMLESLLGREIPVEYHDWRPGDQKVYFSDVRKAAHLLGWAPAVSPREGLTRLRDWIEAQAPQWA